MNTVHYLANGMLHIPFGVQRIGLRTCSYISAMFTDISVDFVDREVIFNIKNNLSSLFGLVMLKIACPAANFFI